MGPSWNFPDFSIMAFPIRMVPFPLVSPKWTLPRPTIGHMPMFGATFGTGSLSRLWLVLGGKFHFQWKALFLPMNLSTNTTMLSLKMKELWPFEILGIFPKSCSDLGISHSIGKPSSFWFICIFARPNRTNNKGDIAV